MTRHLMRSLVLILVASAVSAAFAQHRTSGVALLIGNAAYPEAEAPPKQPVRDARALGVELHRHGFEVDTVENQTKEAMRLALDRFYGKIRPGSAALIFFSGYAVQSERQSYLIPVNAQIWSEPDVRRDGLSLDAILAEMSRKSARVKIAIVDASRRNPFERRFRTSSAGLAPVVAAKGTVVLFSATPGDLVNDAGPDVFMSELVREMQVAGSTIEQIFNRTRMSVSRASKNQQTPWLSSSLDEDFAFGSPMLIPPERVVSSPAAPVPPPGENAVAAPAATPTAPAQLPSSLDGEIRKLNAELKGNPHDSNVRYRRGQLLAERGDFSLAIKDFDEVIRRDPKDAEAFNNRCWSRAIINDLSGALKDCDEALRIKPRYVDALDSRATVRLKSGFFAEAISDYDAALRINPTHASSLYGRGVAKLRVGNLEGGNSDINAAKAIRSNVAAEFATYGIRQ